MIASLWDQIVAAMDTIGYRIDPSETDAIMDRHYTIQLPVVQRDDDASTFTRLRVTRGIRVRIQCREKKNTFFHRDIAQEIEHVAMAVHAVILFETAVLENRAGGVIADISFSAIDCMS